LRDALGFAYLRMLCETASHTHDGYLTRDQALACCDGRADLLQMLCTPTLGEKPFLHQPGEACAERNCLDDSGPWTAGFDYRICGFLKRNPSRGEYKRNQAQKADSRDTRLKAHVYERDGGCCRYCRSGPLKKRGMARARDRRRVLQYDHVDPDRAAGPDGGNYVVACARCNEHKGHRTPDEAGMVLLPEPTPDQRAEWEQLGEQLHDLPDNPHDNQPTNDTTTHTTNDTALVPSIVPATSPDTATTGQPCPQTGDNQQQQPADQQSGGSGSGRVGPPALVSSDPQASQPSRSPEAPDIYHHRSRASPTARASPTTTTATTDHQ
jgi:5-methylcytosine-specific restriction endonuclease McrA